MAENAAVTSTSIAAQLSAILKRNQKPRDRTSLGLGSQRTMRYGHGPQAPINATRSSTSTAPLPPGGTKSAGHPTQGPHEPISATRSSTSTVPLPGTGAMSAGHGAGGQARL